MFVMSTETTKTNDMYNSLNNIANGIENHGPSGSVYATKIRKAIEISKKTKENPAQLALDMFNHDIASAKDQGYIDHARFGEWVAKELSLYVRLMSAGYKAAMDEKFAA